VEEKVTKMRIAKTSGGKRYLQIKTNGNWRIPSVGELEMIDNEDAISAGMTEPDLQAQYERAEKRAVA
jgi:hypothetical protein